MKEIRKIWAVLLLTGIFFGMGSCMKEDIDDIRKELQKQDQRLSNLETNIQSLQSLIEALEDKDYVTGVTALTDGTGYIITFLKSGSITIKHGEKGDNGDTPIVSAKQDTDGKYYWTVNGEWLLDNGNKMPVTGEKGETGNKGTDAIAPQVRINEDTGFWEISTDGGNLWNSTGVKATGDAGDSFFQKAPELSEDNLYYIFTLTNGDEIEIPNYLSRGLIFMQNGQPLTDLVTKIIVTDGELTFSAPENMQVSTHILEGDGWSTKIENNTQT